MVNGYHRGTNHQSRMHVTYFGTWCVSACVPSYVCLCWRVDVCVCVCSAVQSSINASLLTRSPVPIWLCQTRCASMFGTAFCLTGRLIDSLIDSLIYRFEVINSGIKNAIVIYTNAETATWKQNATHLDCKGSYIANQPLNALHICSSILMTLSQFSSRLRAFRLIYRS